MQHKRNSHLFNQGQTWMINGSESFDITIQAYNQTKQSVWTTTKNENNIHF